MPQPGINILILTSGGGGGPLSASQALKDAFRASTGGRYNVRIVDFCKDGSRLGRHFTSLYNFLLRNSGLLSYLFVRCVNILRPDTWTILFRKPRHHLIRLMQEARPEIIFITSPYLVPLVSHVVEALPHRPVLCAAGVDLGGVSLPLWYSESIDLHLLPTTEAWQSYLGRQYPDERGTLSGIVVRRDVNRAGTLDRDLLRKELGLPGQMFIVLLTGSREGYMGYRTLLPSLTAMGNVYTVVICGTNGRMKHVLESDTAHCRESVRILGWRDDIAFWMRAADALIAKPGTQTTAESIAVETPMIAIGYPAVLPQEVGNIAFLRNRGIALVATSGNEVTAFLHRLMADQAFRENLAGRIHQIRVEEIAPARVVESVLQGLRAARPATAQASGIPREQRA